MDQEKMQAIALMRYSAIAPLITGFQEDYPSRDAFFRDASVKGVTAPDGSIKHYAPGTIEKWYYTYKELGFNGLLPSGRSDLGKPRKLDNVFAHAVNGGVCIDEKGSTSLPGLYAAGEVAGGPHGADRLGGNMMVTCQVFGKIAGTYAAQWAGVHRPKTESPAMYPDDRLWEILHKKADTQGLIHELKLVNQHHLLISRTESGLKQVLSTVERIGQQLSESPGQDTINMEAFRLYCLITVSRLMGEAALRRKESRGAHCREDYPTVNPKLDRPMFSDQGI